MGKENIIQRAWRNFSRFAEAMDQDERAHCAHLSELDRMQRAHGNEIAAATRRIEELGSRIEAVESRLP